MIEMKRAVLLAAIALRWWRTASTAMDVGIFPVSFYRKGF